MNLMVPDSPRNLCMSIVVLKDRTWADVGGLRGRDGAGTFAWTQALVHAVQTDLGLMRAHTSQPSLPAASSFSVFPPPVWKFWEAAVKQCFAACS